MKKKNKPIEDPDVQEALNAQLNFKTKIENNSSIIRDLSMGGFDQKKFEKFASDNNLDLKNYKIDNTKQNEIFSEDIIKRIFLTKDGEVNLVANNTLTKNFLVFAVKTEYKKCTDGTRKHPALY